MKEESTMSIKVGMTMRHLRKKAGLSQMEFCRRSYIDLKYISNIENGKRNISLEVLERITETLGIKVSEFFKLMEEIEL